MKFNLSQYNFDDIDLFQNTNEDIIYNNVNYLKIFYLNGDGKFYKAFYESKEGYIKYIFCLKNLDDLKFTKKYSEYREVFSVYGYSGPLSNISNSRQFHLKKFFEKLREEFRKLKVVTEFVRFNPIIQNYLYLKDFYNLSLVDENYIIDIENTKNFSEYRSSVRSGINQMEKMGIKIKKENNLNSVENFYKLYNDTMKRLNQKSYLNFNKSFFLNIFKFLSKDDYFILTAYRETEILASSIFLINSNYVDYFLSSNKRIKNFNHYASHLIIKEATNICIKLKKKKLHLGGGSESLKYFKSNFTKKTIPYMVGKNIFDEKIYSEISQIYKKGNSIKNRDFFPIYRS